MAESDGGSGSGAAVQLVCNACQCVVDDSQRQDHYRSEWHRYNVKRRVNNLAPITSDVFQQKLAALNEQKVAGEAEKTAAKCNVCGNVFQSQKAYQNHLSSKKHLKKLEKKAHSQANSQPATPTPAPGPAASASGAGAPGGAPLTTKPVVVERSVVLSPAPNSKPIASASPQDTKSTAAAAAAAAIGAPIVKTVKSKSAKAKAPKPDSKASDDDAENEDGEGEDDGLSDYNPADTLPLGSCFFCSKFFPAKPPKSTAAAAASDNKSTPAAAAATTTTATAAAAPNKTADEKSAAPAAAAADAPSKGDVEAALDHMAKAHGFFIPCTNQRINPLVAVVGSVGLIDCDVLCVVWWCADLEYCSDVHGLCGYLGAKVGMGRVCLYCDGRGKSRYASFQAVAQHMVAKGHCKIRFEENDVDDEVLEFYDFPDRDGAAAEDDEDDTTPATTTAAGAKDSKSALITIEDAKRSATANKPARVAPTLNEHGELVLGDGSVIGHRDLKRYYTQNSRPKETRESVLINRLVSSYKLLALPGYSASGVVTPQMKKAQKAARARAGAYNEKVGTNSNLLIRKHFRVVCVTTHCIAAVCLFWLWSDRLVFWVLAGLQATSIG